MELEKAQAVAAQEKREHKSKPVPNSNEENEFQSQDELIPEKLERVSINEFELCTCLPWLYLALLSSMFILSRLIN